MLSGIKEEMQFTEITFAVFLTVVFALYWLLLRKWVKAQNMLLLCASYLFYGWWDWRFLALIMLTTLTTFVTALWARSRYGRWLTAANIVINLGILVVFKYLNFFSENLQRLFALAGWNLDWFTLDVLLPVGISFYTFQAIAYSVDVYRRRVEACDSVVAFATFIAYFPQLVAGPIERASQLLPQIISPRRWDEAMAVSGLRMILFGVMKKVCIADMLALYADRLYSGSLGSPLATLAAGIVFTLEIYCDFSAYSEIARGVSRLLGIELMANFRFPYFSRNILEFWRRWHISLMWWFRDYVYIPLGGNRRGATRTAVNADFFKSWLPYRVTGRAYANGRNLVFEPQPIVYDPMTNQESVPQWDSLIAADPGRFYSQYPLTPSPDRVTQSARVLDADRIAALRRVARVFDRHATDYQIIIGPNRRKIALNNDDLQRLKQIFDFTRVHDFSCSMAAALECDTLLYDNTHYRPSFSTLLMRRAYGR